MRRSTIFLVVLAAFAVGVVGALLLRNAEQASTAATVVPLPGDADGDGLGDEVDYYPNDPLQ